MNKGQKEYIYQQYVSQAIAANNRRVRNSNRGEVWVLAIMGVLALVCVATALLGW